MGAWGFGIFDDDAALDFIYELENSGDEIAEAMAELFQAVNSADYIDSDEGAAVIVCSAIIDAAINNTEYEYLSNEHEDILAFAKNSKLSELKNSAHSALEKVLGENSEVNELWSETEDYDSWKNTVASIKERLK